MRGWMLTGRLRHGQSHTARRPSPPALIGVRQAAAALCGRLGCQSAGSHSRGRSAVPGEAALLPRRGVEAPRFTCGRLSPGRRRGRRPCPGEPLRCPGGCGRGIRGGRAGRGGGAGSLPVPGSDTWWPGLGRRRCASAPGASAGTRGSGRGRAQERAQVPKIPPSVPPPLLRGAGEARRSGGRRLQLDPQRGLVPVRAACRCGEGALAPSVSRVGGGGTGCSSAALGTRGAGRAAQERGVWRRERRLGGKGQLRLRDLRARRPRAPRTGRPSRQARLTWPGRGAHPAGTGAEPRTLSLQLRWLAGCVSVSMIFPLFFPLSVLTPRC